MTDSGYPTIRHLATRTGNHLAAECTDIVAELEALADPDNVDVVEAFELAVGRSDASAAAVLACPPGLVLSVDAARWAQLTLRAVLVGMAIGAVMCLSNLYVILKTGWSLGVTLTACILAFAAHHLFHVPVLAGDNDKDAVRVDGAFTLCTEAGLPAIDLGGAAVDLGGQLQDRL